MNFRWDKKYLYWGITAFLAVCGSICFYYLLFHSSKLWDGFFSVVGIIMPVVDGFVLAYLLSPVLNHIERKILYPLYASVSHTERADFTGKIKKRLRKISIFITLFLLAFVLYCFFSIVIQQLVESIQSIIMQFPYYIHNLNDWLLGIFENNKELEETMSVLLERHAARLEEWATTELIPQANTLVRTLSTGLIGNVIGLAKALWNLLIGFIISIYLLDGKETFAGQGKKIVYALFHTDTANVFISNVRFIHKTFIGFVSGKIVDSIIIGIICYFGTILMGTPYAVLISVIIGVTNVVPFFGPYMGAIPSAILILMVDPRQCLYFIIFILILQQFDGNILGPKILGDSTGLNSFWVIFSITFFGGLFGILGMVIGVPVFAVIYAGIKAITGRKLEERHLPVSTQAYLQVFSIGQDGTFLRYDTEPGDISGQDHKEKPGESRIGFGDSWLLLKRRNKDRSPAPTDKAEETESGRSKKK